MWSGFDVISHPELAAQFSDSFPYYNDIFKAVNFFVYISSCSETVYFFKHMYMYIAVVFFLLFTLYF